MYEIFLHYKDWKLGKEAKYFDFMDLGNHILRQMKTSSDGEYSEEIKDEIYG